MSREIVIQKVLGFGIVAAAILYFTPMQLVVCFSVLGQGHFIGAYLYQWKAGKIKAKWVMLFAGLGLLLFIPAYLTERVEWFALGAGVLFFIHHFQDEVTLWGKERSKYRFLEQLPPMVLFSTLAADRLLGTSFTKPATIALLLPLFAYIYTVAKRKYKPDALSAYLFVISAGLAAISWSGLPIASEVVLSSVILLHYVCWYVYFYFRFANNSERLWTYIADMAIVHIVIFAAFALFLYTELGNAIFVYLFGTIYFYIWTILHILSSIRRKDYRALIS